MSLNAASRREVPYVHANGRTYQWPQRPVVVVCIDGSEPDYIASGLKEGYLPNIARIIEAGTCLTAKSVIPSFTNPNNISIITGRPPSVHGIAGNYFYDTSSGTEVMMNDARFMRAETILKAFQDAGAKVAMVTAKDKLCALLAKGLDFSKGQAVAFSAEKADRATQTSSGIDNVLEFSGLPLPEVYSADLSEFVFAAGVRLLETFTPDLMYLSTTDYVQHKAGPGSADAKSFYCMIDRYVGELDALGCVLALTADHGMNDKFRSDGQPDVFYLQEWLDQRLGEGRARVILPITDPYVGHHGALGSFATVYLPAGVNCSSVIADLRAAPAVELVATNAEAAAAFELPEDRIGDLVVISTRHKVIGTSADRHDLSGLSGPLRSHGGISEQSVPMILNRKIGRPVNHELRNFDVFDIALNAVLQE
ncbi:phosphonoacetate hydrolase [Chelatococcus asaccharovorans]|uniref:Phosphonoacetate hydrolase n=1 Tax=Chelatococcus asaccharovorans TaxID=28210 RepID=A0A2V3UI58_9HYPH|nr:phosphonoacetate hydrolase [Chelatococcus asaccharovorans]MBS7706305.1 phosphonoacetate hydrolase [Chelatococcus asaccharovorans]PXW65055.1 phosphonoacetate hydrolase [Chelatococcus asaccharovorans]